MATYGIDKIKIGSNNYDLQPKYLASPNDNSLATIDWTGQITSASWLAGWDASTYDYPTIRAISPANLAATLYGTLDNRYVNVGGDTMTGELRIGAPGQTNFIPLNFYRGSAHNNKFGLCGETDNGGSIYASDDTGKTNLISVNLDKTVFSADVQIEGVTYFKNSMWLSSPGATKYVDFSIYRGAKNNMMYLCGNANANGGHLIVKNDEQSSQIDFQLYQTVFDKPVVAKTKLASNILQGSASGWHLIKIQSATNYMTAFTIRVYQAYAWNDIVISGYNYSTNNWYTPQAVIMGTTGTDSMTVHFGYTSTKNLWVAIPASNYFGIEIIDCVEAYTYFDSWKDLFSISYVAGSHTNLPGTIQATVTARSPWYRGQAITGAVWNDYAEYRESDCEEFGRVLIEKGDDSLTQSTERLQHFAGISSDTWGFCQGETEKAKTPIAVAGRVLAYPYQDRDNYKPGDCVCAAPGGTVDIMTREEVINWPDRIVGTVSCVPDYEEWGSGDRDPVKVDGRIWIKVK